VLEKLFDVNPDYIMKGEQPRFRIRGAKLDALEHIPFQGTVAQQIASVEYSIALLDAEVEHLKRLQSTAR
jgi:hypothetical protein